MGTRIPCYHLFLNHLSSGLLFKDREDYLTGWNRILLCQSKVGIVIYAFALMSNHFHFLIRGTAEQAEEFFSHYQKLTAMYMQTKYGEQAFGRKMVMGDLVLIDSPDMFRTEVAYILRNPLKARISNPFHYEWSSCFVYFNPFCQSVPGISLKDLPISKRRSIFRSRTFAPDQYHVFNDRIVPMDIVDYEYVEKLFDNSIDFFEAIRNWNTERDVWRNRDEGEHNAYDDEFIVGKLPSVYKELGITDNEELDSVMTQLLIRGMKKRYGCSKKQVIRVTGIPEDVVKKYF